MEKIRAFIAIEVNEESTLSEILEYQSRLQKSIGPLKLVDKHLMHITIRFLGDITTDHAKLIYEFIENEINKIYFSDLDKKIVAKIKGAGDFNKNVFFVKIDGVLPLLQEINIKIESFLMKIPEIEREEKKFNPHLTVARAKRNFRENQTSHPQKNAGQIPYPQLKDEYREKLFGDWTLERVVLKKSTLTPKGPIYENLTTLR